MTTTDRHLHEGDAGFTLLEVLVALVLASLLMIAVGGLFVFVGQLHDRVKTTGLIEQSLLDARAAGAVLSSWSSGLNKVSITGIDPAGFSVQRISAADGTTAVARVTLGGSDDKHAAFLGVSNSADAPPSSVDLSAFDTAEIEYLTSTAQSIAWVRTDQLGTAKLRAIRLDLTSNLRRWFVILWVDNGRQ